MALSEHTRREGRTALRNGLKLATSLLLTWGVALVITFKVPKYLGPVAWGAYKYGFEYSASLAVFALLGVDTYISREIAVRPKHASDFLGGVIATRALLLIPLYAYGWFHLEHKLPDERVAAALFGLVHVIMLMNGTFQQILEAASTVGRLAVWNVVAKIIWGGAIFAAVTLRAPFWVLPLPLLASESLKAFALYRAVKDAVDLKLRLDLAETLRVLRVSLPFFVANAAVYLGGSLDVVLLRELVPTGSEEVGWYSAAREISRLSALMMPVLTGVLVPMMSRAHFHDEREFFALLRRGIEGVMVLSIPLTLLLALGSDAVIELVLKQEYLPAAHSLEWLAPTFVLAYANCLLWLALMIMGRSWTITIVSIGGMLLLPALILLVVPHLRGLGPGKMGMGAAISLSARELAVLLVFLWVVGRKAIDARAAAAIAKSVGICVAVVPTHVLLTGLGPWRLVVDAGLYAVLALALGVVRVADFRGLVRLVMDRKRIQAEGRSASAAAS